jgi:2,3-bisphosphoglycerate-independent phosphoglycerate mutase
MANFDLMRRLARETGGKILLLVMDGLGGLPRTPDGPTELEAASTPNLDRLAREGSTGMTIPVARGIAPGSGPAHLGLFGYDPLHYEIGRGVLEATGVGLEVNAGDVAVRGNFATVDENGVITDRRAGRIPTEEGAKRVELLRQIQFPGVQIDIAVGKEYRFAMVLRGEGLSGEISDTDPQQEGYPPLAATPTNPDKAAVHTAEIINQWLAQAAVILKDHAPANMVTLRGFDIDPALPKYSDVYKLNAACVAVYPMYKGVARLVGMTTIKTGANDTPQDEFNTVASIWNDYTFVFCHIKYTDSRGEDGDFDGKVAVIEQVDAALPTLMNLDPDVFIVTGDHSTPSTYMAHTWHPVPTLLWAPKTHMPDGAQSFGERQCIMGALGQFPAADLMPLALAHAKRLDKFGA